MNTNDSASAPRIVMLDIARLYGMILVYYGHAIERVMYLENATAALHYKFIYSFHMPFFFLLSGMVAKEVYARQPWGAFLGRMARSRLTPYLFFTAALALSTLFLQGHFVAVDLSTPAGYLEGAAATLLGFPVFNIPLWFLACLVTVEVLHRLLAPLTRSDVGLWLTAAACYLGGYWLNLQYSFLMEGVNVWFLNEAPVVYAFYLVGVFMRRRGLTTGAMKRPFALGAALVFLLLVLTTFDLNQGPFRMFDAVVIVLGAHGNILLFPVTALAGSLLLLYLAKATGPNAWLEYLGRNVIALFCLNGVFYHYLNGPFAAWYVEHFSGEPFSVFMAGAGMTLASLAVCVPVVWLLDRHLPWALGRARSKRPL